MKKTYYIFAGDDHYPQQPHRDFREKVTYEAGTAYSEDLRARAMQAKEKADWVVVLNDDMQELFSIP